jgi:polyisoprenoid-binding protein YceI
MKKQIICFLSIVFCLGGNVSFGQTYRPDNNASFIRFTIKNMGMGTEGKMSGLEGEIKFNPADLKNSFFSVTADANTINTDIDVRDSTLKTKEYLNTQLYPKISFVSKQITPGSKAGMYFVKGTLTIKGISKEINFPFTVTPKNEGIQLTGDMRVNRLDYKIGVGSIVLSDNLTVSLNVFAKKA